MEILRLEFNGCTPEIFIPLKFQWRLTIKFSVFHMWAIAVCHRWQSSWNPPRQTLGCPVTTACGSRALTVAPGQNSVLLLPSSTPQCPMFRLQQCDYGIVKPQITSYLDSSLSIFLPHGLRKAGSKTYFHILGHTSLYIILRTLYII